MADPIVLEPLAGVRVSWDPEDLDGWGAEGESAPRAIDGARGFDGRIRVVTVVAGGAALLVAGALPKGARLDEESIAAVRVSGGSVLRYETALVSTELGSDRRIRRVGFELYRPDDDYPVRAAGDAEDTGSDDEDGRERRWARLAFRLDGEKGRGLAELVGG